MRRDSALQLSYVLRIGLLTGRGCGRVGAAALSVHRYISRKFASRGRLTFQQAWPEHGNEADTRGHRRAVSQQPDVSGSYVPGISRADAAP